MDKWRSFLSAHLLAGLPPTLGGVAKYLGRVGPREILLAVVVFSPVCGVCFTSAQTSSSITWTETSTLGYAGAGFGLAYAVCYECDYEAAFTGWVTGLVGGGVVGYLVGSHGEAQLRNGNWPSDAALWAIRVGTVTTFASLGTVVAGVVINETEGNEPGEDERTLVIFSVVGGLLGGAIQYLDERRLSRLVAVQGALPLVRMGRTGSLVLGMRVMVP